MPEIWMPLMEKYFTEAEYLCSHSAQGRKNAPYAYVFYADYT